MQSYRAAGDVLIQRRHDTLELRVLAAGGAGDGPQDVVVLQDYDGPALPHRVDGAIVDLEAGLRVRGWLLALGREERLQGRRLTVLRHDPALFAPLLRRHALRRRERWVARLLLAVLRWPVGPRLLRAWHARRG